jgi:hypothetical protein
MRSQTWFASMVCTIAVLPGFAVGALFASFLYFFGGWIEGSDFLYLRAIFGLETPGQIYEWAFAHAIPTTLQGILAGYVAVLITEKICKYADNVLAARIAGAVYTVFLICLVIMMLVTLGVTDEMLLSILQLGGLWIGLNMAAPTMPMPRQATV